ncbi:mannosidase [Reticulomyxa filosa]|uniref:Mannosidase n=1 Tax=Reticulomyxa filosa TaxID=46433 RepID=X6NIG1_RETFI|nr:mannosidase [Reticulomyxa filosa]|eukprot:ETO26110.1 mannosidase [Reticulomyxa filosa]
MEDVDSIPKVSMTSPVAFYEKLEKSVDKLPRWIGELYFELHRGTYTTHAAIKKGNRRGECLLQQCEFLHSVLDLLDPKGHEYPKKVIDQAWRDLLLNQFHDVLPGSSIELANIDARNIYKHIDESISKLIHEGQVLLAKYAGHLAKSVTGMQTVEADGLVVNTCSFERHELITVPSDWSPLVAKSEFVQKTFDKNLLGYFFFFYLKKKIDKQKMCDSKATITEHKSDETVKMENNDIQVVFNKNGCITSLIHKATKREAIDKGFVGNEFLLFDDVPVCDQNFTHTIYLFWDAWDVEIYHLQKFKTLANNTKDLKIIERGPLRVGIEFTVAISKLNSKV